MQSLNITVMVTDNGGLFLDSPVDLPVGKYHAILLLEEQMIGEVRPSIRQAQSILRQYISADKSLSTELIAERRQEALDE
jgi:hypothetical protein